MSLIRESHFTRHSALENMRFITFSKNCRLFPVLSVSNMMHRHFLRVWCISTNIMKQTINRKAEVIGITLIVVVQDTINHVDNLCIRIARYIHVCDVIFEL